MLRLFRNIRRGLIARNRVTNYLLYAIGEIVLVVIGILIALQINNWNDQRKARGRELQYLRNIRADLVNNIAEIDAFVAVRTEAIENAQVVVEYLDGKPITDAHDFNRRCISAYDWKRFTSVNYTFEELINSGNLALISSEAIKSLLLRLDSADKATKAEENHFRFDSEELLYKPVYSQVDLHPMLRDFGGDTKALNPSHFDVFRKDPRFKNGFLMVILEFSTMNEQLADMKSICEKLLVEIDAELGPANGGTR